MAPAYNPGVLEAYVRQALQRARIHPSRARGQHFLIDDAVLAAILRAAELDRGDLIVEVGPGLGTLTQSLAARAGHVAAYELDESLVRYLRNWVLPETPNIELYDVAFNKYVYEQLLTKHGIAFVSPDAEVLPDEDVGPGERPESGVRSPESGVEEEDEQPSAVRSPQSAEPVGGSVNKADLGPRTSDTSRPVPTLKIVTNLPYQISSAFLHFAVDYVATYERIVVMLQREVAQRVIAQPGDPGYNSFSLYLQTFLGPRWVCAVPAEAFSPPPRVESAVLELRPLRLTEQPQPRNRQLYFKLIEGVFRRRRKQFANALHQTFGHLSPELLQAALATSGIDPATRAQDLGMADYVRLADTLAGQS
jgi:16S rRNA A1518/A1519 N6-dimethyltransferase RsmA/KsgA/DIM1 with predicted DNA glycosylase/AP lyase activity